MNGICCLCVLIFCVELTTFEACFNTVVLTSSRNPHFTVLVDWRNLKISMQRKKQQLKGNLKSKDRLELFLISFLRAKATTAFSTS